MDGKYLHPGLQGCKYQGSLDSQPSAFAVSKVPTLGYFMARKGVPVPMGFQNERHPNGPVKEAFGFEHRVLDQLVNKLVNQLVDQTS